LIDSCFRENLSDEELVYRFFNNINMFPEKKDYFIKDFDDFYFKVRPKFTSRLIKVLLEGDLSRGILGLFYLISEYDESFMSACSAL
jgi:predicted SnoaL-like aldol condensation-catalyzing enzyme